MTTTATTSPINIIIEVRTVYGRDTVYPVNAAAKTLAAISGTKTLPLHVIRMARELGMTIEQVYTAI